MPKSIKKLWYGATRLVRYVNHTVNSDCIPIQRLKAQKNHGNLAPVIISIFSKTNLNSLFVKLLSVTV